MKRKIALLSVPFSAGAHWPRNSSRALRVPWLGRNYPQNEGRFLSDKFQNQLSPGRQRTLKMIYFSTFWQSKDDQSRRAMLGLDGLGMEAIHRVRQPDIQRREGTPICGYQAELSRAYFEGFVGQIFEGEHHQHEAPPGWRHLSPDGSGQGYLRYAYAQVALFGGER